MGNVRSLTLALSLILVVVTGCTPAQYEWSSDLGRQCFLDCQRGRYQCYGGCFNNVFCQRACRDDESICMGSCPDLRKVKKS